MLIMGSHSRTLVIIIFMCIFFAVSTMGCISGTYEGTIAIHSSDSQMAYFAVVFPGGTSFNKEDPLGSGAQRLDPKSTLLSPIAVHTKALTLWDWLPGQPGTVADQFTIVVGRGDIWKEMTIKPMNDRFSVYLEWDGTELRMQRDSLSQGI